MKPPCPPLPSPAPFPTDSLPPLLLNAVREVEAHVQAPVEIAFSTALAALSLAAQGRLSVARTPSLISPVSIYACVIAESGERKSAVARHFFEPIFRLEEKMAALAETQLANRQASRDAWDARYGLLKKELAKHATGTERHAKLVRELEEHLAHQEKPPRVPKLVYQDVTPEALQDGLANRWPSAALISDEAHSILHGRAVQDLSLLTRLWEGGRILVDRCTGDSFVRDGANLTVSLMIQPQPFAKFLAKNDAEARHLGLLARFLVAFPLTRQGSRFHRGQSESWQHVGAFNQRVAEMLEASSHHLASEEPEKVVMTFSPEADALWVEFFNWCETESAPWGSLREVKDYAAKAGDNLARLAALFETCQSDSTVISGQAMHSARNVAYWYALEFKRLFAPPPPPVPVPQWQIDGETLWPWLRKHAFHINNLFIANTDILKLGPRAVRNAARLNAAIEYLTKVGYVWPAIYHRKKFIQLNAAIQWDWVSVF